MPDTELKHFSCTVKVFSFSEVFIISTCGLIHALNFFLFQVHTAPFTKNTSQTEMCFNEHLIKLADYFRLSSEKSR